MMATLVIRSYDEKLDYARIEDFERRCEVGSSERVFLFTDTLGDPLCRIRNSPVFIMLVAEFEDELVGVIQGTIKLVTIDRPPPRDLAQVGYILALRVAPQHRRKGIGSSLVRSLEDWFVTNQVEYAYMATEKNNEASVKLFIQTLNYNIYRIPAILVNPINNHRDLIPISRNIEMKKLKIEEAISMYRKYMSKIDFFPYDIDNILKNKLNLGTWVAYYKGDQIWKNYYNVIGSSTNNARCHSNNWAMVSVWNSCELFKLRLGKAPLLWLIYTKVSKFLDNIFPCIKLSGVSDFYKPFGFYFIYGVYGEGKASGKLIRALCQFVHNMAIMSSKDCRAVVTEVGSQDKLRLHIPHWKLMSCPEDLWCIKALKSDHHNHLERSDTTHVHDLIRTPPTRALFVDPREV